MKNSKFVLTLFFIFYFLLFTFPIHAQEDGIGESRINAASPLYFLTSVREILELKFARTTQAKASRILEFADRRLKEVNSLTNVSREELIEPTLEQYWFYLHELQGKVTLQDEIMTAKVGGEAVKDMDVLLEVYNRVSVPSAKRSVRLAIYRLSQWDQQFADKLILVKQPVLAQKIMDSKLTGCEFLSQEASSSALAGVEKGVFAKRAQKCFDESGSE